MELYRFVPITDVKLKEMETEKNYVCTSKLFDDIVNRSGGYIKNHSDNLLSVLLPYTTPEQKTVTDDFVIQKMNELVNDILCKPNYSHLHRLLKLTPDSNKIALFIDRWAKENDIFKNQTK